MNEKKSISLGPQSSQHKGDLFATEGQKAGNQTQEKKIEDKEKEKKTRVICARVGQRTASGYIGDRHRTTAVYKGTRGNPMLGQGALPYLGMLTMGDKGALSLWTSISQQLDPSS